MPYLTTSQFIDYFGYQETLELTNLDNPNTNVVNNEKLEASINYAENLINSYLSRRIAIPVINPPLVLQNLTADIARYQLDLYGAREDVKYRYEQALYWLKDFAKGLVDLGLQLDDLGSEIEVTDARSQTRFSSIKPVFNRDTLK